MKESVQQRRQHVDKAHKLSIVHQCKLLNIHRSGLYYKPVGESDLNLELMRLIDEKHILHPWLGVPRMTVWLQKDKGYQSGLGNGYHLYSCKRRLFVFSCHYRSI